MKPPMLVRTAQLASLATFAALAGLGAACDGRTEAAPESPARRAPPSPTVPTDRSPSLPARAGASGGAAAPRVALAPVAADRLCVTKGALAPMQAARAAAAAPAALRADVPALRAVALGSSGEAAALRLVFRGETATTSALASGASRRQLGLKLRAQDGCNLVYVMWRLDPKPALEVSVKRNPGTRTHAECGARGYSRVRPAERGPLPALAAGGEHTLRAEIAGGELRAWIDGRLAWRGALPDTARDLAGPAGLRSDNVRFDLLELAAPPGEGAAGACTADRGDD